MYIYIFNAYIYILYAYIYIYVQMRSSSPKKSLRTPLRYAYISYGLLKGPLKQRFVVFT